MKKSCAYKSKKRKRADFGGLMKDIGMGILDTTIGNPLSIATGKNISDFTDYEYQGKDFGKLVNSQRDMLHSVAPGVLNAFVPGAGTALQIGQQVGKGTTGHVEKGDSFMNPESMQLAQMGTQFIPNLAAYGGRLKKSAGGSVSTNNANKTLDKIFTEFEGASHEQAAAMGKESIPIGDYSVEGKETRISFGDEDYIFSDRIPYDDKDTFASHSKKIFKKYGAKDRENDPRTIKSFLAEAETLRAKQEDMRNQLGLGEEAGTLNEQGMRAYGGFLKKRMSTGGSVSNVAAETGDDDAVIAAARKRMQEKYDELISKWTENPKGSLLKQMKHLENQMKLADNGSLSLEQAKKYLPQNEEMGALESAEQISTGDVAPEINSLQNELPINMETQPGQPLSRLENDINKINNMTPEEYADYANMQETHTEWSGPASMYNPGGLSKKTDLTQTQATPGQTQPVNLSEQGLVAGDTPPGNKSGLWGTDYARAGAIIGSAAYNFAANKKPETLSSAPFESPYLEYRGDLKVNEEPITTMSARNRSAILNTGDMSGASARDNLLSLDLNTKRALSDQYTNVAQTNLNRRESLDRVNADIDRGNRQTRLNVQDINDRNRGAYTSNNMNTANVLGQNVLEGLNQMDNRYIAENYSDLFGNKGQFKNPVAYGGKLKKRRIKKGK
jgi:hypothetical protein